jgi:hypothetical protein
MSYVFTAAVGRPDVLAALTHPLLAPSVRLGGGFAMRPVIDPLDLLGGDDDITWDDAEALRFDPLDADAAAESLGPVLAPASVRGPVAYVHIEMAGGPPDEAVCVWRDGELVWRAAGESLDERFSPEALRTIGVVAADGADEFDTLGLGRHREMVDWLGEP